MLAFLKSRTLLTILALLLLAFCIWYFGPFIALGDPSSQYFPLGTLGRQLIAMAIVVAVWVAFVLVKRLRANSASDQLIAAVVKQPGGNEPASAEAVQLRERFEEAVATLKQKRRSGHSLYDLPWYVIIGAPGSGKTTALVNSGLNFPLEQRTGKGALRGVGGTRNCDWWFTDEAVLLDTAGRYTTQDSDTASDSAGWAEFLALLRKYRKRRPLNGVILTISAQDLLTQGQGGQEAHVLAVRRRLNELNKELRIQLPVYLMVTKCDLVAGFTEYFDDLAQDGRAQVWGVTFPYEQTLKGGAADACPAEFDALIARLNERLFARLEDERDVRRRLKIFGFPQQMAAMKDALSTFASEVFGGTRFDQRVLLRGIYFTSGTQVGNPIDRLLGAIGRRFAIAPDAVAPPAGKGRAYFIQRLLKDVLFAESGLAGIDRRTEAVKAAGQLGVYVAILLAVVLCIVAWSVSYGRNASYLSHVADAAKKLGAPLSDDSSLDRVVARLDAVRDVDAVANPASSSWLMGWGLNQRGSVGGAARRAYARELRSWLLPTVAARFRRHLDESSGSAALLYAYLKGYLLLVHPENLDKEHGDQVAFLAEVEWRAEFPADPERRESVSRHFGFLLENNQEILPISFDQPAVTRARRAIALASQPEIIYEYIKIDSASNTANDLRLDEILGIGAERVFKLKNGRLSDPVRGLYTKKVFEAVTGKGGIADFVERFRAEDWVWGDSKDNRPAVASRETAAAVLSLYEQDYVRTWKAILDNLQSVPLKDLAQTKDALQILAGPMSPVKSLLKLVDEHTNLKKAPDPASSRGGALAGLGNLLQPLRSAAAAPVVEPGAYITEQFAGIRQLVAAPGPIDNILARLLELQQKVQTIGPNVGGTDAASPQASAAVGDAATAVQRDAQMLPPTVGGVLAQVAGDAMAVVGGGVRTKLETLYQSDVVKACTDAIDNRYPFVRDAKQDVPLEDFGRLFGPGGAYDQFFKERLKDFVDTSRDQWAWRTLSSGQSLGLPVNILKRFHDAVEIRNTFFPAGKSPEVTFTVSSYRLSENTLRFVLEVAGQKLEDRNGPEKSLKFTWGPSPEGAAATFEGRGSDTQNIAFSGPWAWFKLVSAGTVQSDAPEQFGLKLQAGLHWAIVNVKAASVLNPLSKMTLLQRFQCN